jgi:hypothetical protein
MSKEQGQETSFPAIMFQNPTENITNTDNVNMQVFSIPNKSFNEYSLFLEKNKEDRKNYAYEALYPIMQVSPFSLYFFSKENIRELQTLVRYNVWKASDKKYRIGDQNETELKTIMRGVFLEYSRMPSNSRDYAKSLINLNERCIKRILPDLLSNITQYIYYRKDIEKPYKMIERPENESIKGQKEFRDPMEVYFGVSTTDRLKLFV